MASQILQHRYLQWVLNLLAVVYLWSIFVIPNRLDWLLWWYLFYLPLEVPVFAALLLAPSRWRGPLMLICTLVISAGLVFRLSDMAAFMVFGRPFNPVLDLYLLPFGFDLLRSSVGVVAAILIFAALALVLVLIGLGTWHALRRVHRLLSSVSARTAYRAVAALMVLWVITYSAGWSKSSRYFFDQLLMHGNKVVSSVQELQQFREAISQDPYHDVAADKLFSALRNKDVLVIFVESYGRVLIDSERYRNVVRPQLSNATEVLSQSGYNSASAFIESSTMGGLSWLAHASAMSGLWIDSQMRYDALILSQRASLISLFARAGWRTVGVMPAITYAWPEGQYFGYDQLYDAPSLGYQGLPFNYVTMPDQFTLAQFQQRERRGSAADGQRKPVMAEIALISSHAPWTPIPQLLNWQMINDGSEFNQQASSGYRPDQVWSNLELLKNQYRDSVVYVINTLVSYVLEYGDEDLVVMVLGDHQPMPLIAEGASVADVLVHIISSDPDVIAAIGDWQWTPGMLPAADAPLWRMDSIRERLLQTFSPDL